MACGLRGYCPGTGKMLIKQLLWGSAVHYPLAFCLPATVPWQSERLMAMCLSFSMFLFFVCCFGVRFLRLLFHFGVLWCHFVLFLCLWGSFGDPGIPRGLPKGPSRKSDEKVGSLDALWPPKGVPLGTHFRDFFRFSVFFQVLFFEALFWRLLGSLGNPSNHENDGFV